MAKKNKDTKLDILNQTRDRTPMPRPVIYKSHKTYDRNATKEEFREEMDDELYDGGEIEYYINRKGDL